jgi:hypothetical protein
MIERKERHDKGYPASGLYWTELRIFPEVAKSKSFNKAAEELGISQPTVGRAVRRLETALNIKLLGAGARRGAYGRRFKIGASAGVGRRGNREDHPQSCSGVDDEVLRPGPRELWLRWFAKPFPARRDLSLSQTALPEYDSRESTERGHDGRYRSAWRRRAFRPHHRCRRDFGFCGCARGGSSRDRNGNSTRDSFRRDIEPASNVNGDYQAVYHEGYAQAFLALGFSEEFLLQMFSEVTDSMTITATTKALFLRAKAGRAERQITLGSPGPVEVFGTKIPDRYARFDQPNRLVISFTAPNGKRVEAVQTFYADGYVTVLSIDGAPHLKPVRIWKRVVNNEQARRKLPQLFPL